jgi:hypothetical protein
MDITKTVESKISEFFISQSIAFNAKQTDLKLIVSNNASGNLKYELYQNMKFLKYATINEILKLNMLEKFITNEGKVEQKLHEIIQKYANEQSVAKIDVQIKFEGSMEYFYLIKRQVKQQVQLNQIF